jgi:hypothetical protein
MTRKPSAAVSERREKMVEAAQGIQMPARNDVQANE